MSLVAAAGQICRPSAHLPGVTCCDASWLAIVVSCVVDRGAEARAGPLNYPTDLDSIFSRASGDCADGCCTHFRTPGWRVVGGTRDVLDQQRRRQPATVVLWTAYTIMSMRYSKGARQHLRRRITAGLGCERLRRCRHCRHCGGHEGVLGRHVVAVSISLSVVVVEG